MAESSSMSSREAQNLSHLEEDDSGITMLDVLEEEQELEDDANAVLGGSDDRNCTYSQGYVNRQALYACITCLEPKSPGFSKAGICLACSYHCHEGHELVELYTKRNFRCDCGNSKFPNNPCRLEPKKDMQNEHNQYNQNFEGVYCVCKRPYPDPEDSVEDEMIQCIICEDWYHGRHLMDEVPAEKDYSEMVCGGCMGKHSFLWNYKGLSVTHIQKAETDESIDILNLSATSDKSVIEKEDTVESAVAKKSTVPNQQNDNKSSSINKEEESDTLSLQVNDSTVKKTENIAVSGCKMPQQMRIEENNGARFWPDGWRKRLCTCDSCKKIYSQEGVSYLLDEQDTVQAYEENGKTKRAESQYEQGMKALSGLDRIKQVEAISEYNNLKSQLKEYLQKFVENKKIVREEDIREFFTKFESQKKQKVNIPYFCR